MAPDAAGVIKRVINFTWKGICSKRSQPPAPPMWSPRSWECVLWYPADPGDSTRQPPSATLSSLFAAWLLYYFPRICLKALHGFAKQCCQIFWLWGGADVTSTTQVTASELGVVFIPCTELSGNEGFLFPGLVNSSFKSVPTLHLQE